jgi:hypothetical protein
MTPTGAGNDFAVLLAERCLVDQCIAHKKTCAMRLELDFKYGKTVYQRFLGPSTMIIWRPSSLGMFSTTEQSANSSRMRSSKRMPMSW